MSNDQLVLIGGESTTGKSACLRNLKNPEGVMYLNLETNKKLPFASRFKEYNVTNPLQVQEALTKAESMPHIHTIVVDSLTFMLDQWKSQYLHTAKDTQKAWANFAEFFKTLMLQGVARSSKNIVFTAHTLTVLNEQTMMMETKIPVQGSLKNNGIEAFFSTIVYTKVLPVEMLKKYENPHLTFSEDEEEIGLKHVFQTRLTKETVGDKIRSNMGMWSKSETYIDNDAQILLDRLTEYYGEAKQAA